MQEHLGNPESLPIRNFFDLIVGTSTGGIVGLGLGVKNWSVPVCMQKFEHVCKQAFTAKPPGLKWLGYLASTSRYKTQRLESALRSAFDEDKDRLLFGPNSDSETPFVRVAVTATLVPSNDAAILANYNGGHGSSNHEKREFQHLQTSSGATPATGLTSRNYLTRSIPAHTRTRSIKRSQDLGSVCCQFPASVFRQGCDYVVAY